jgi:hypothetical protein
VTVEPWEVPADLGDLFLYGGKHRPTLYLDPVVRQGISTFALLADLQELETGIRRLEADIRSRRIVDVMASYVHAGGDYAFVVAERRT